MAHRLLIISALVAVTSAGFGQSAPLAIVNAHIEVGNGKVIEKGTIVLRDGKIVSVNSDTAPAGMATFDAHGLPVYPGFVDAYNSRGVNLPTLTNTATPPESRTQAPPTMWEGNRKGIRAQVNVADGWKVADFSDNYKQGLLSGLVGPGTGLIRGSAAFVEYRKSDPVLVKNAGMEISPRSGGGGGGGGTSQGYPGSLLGNVALCRQVLYDAKTYGERKDLGGAPQKDDAYEALLPALSRKVPSIIEADSDREVFRALNIADEFDLKTILKGGRECSASAERISKGNVAVLLRIDYTDAPDREQKSKDPDATPTAVLEDRYQEWVKRMGNAKRLADGGVHFGFSSDGSLIDDYLTNVRRVIKVGGLSRDAALKAMTSEAAEIVGVADKLGTIEPGKIANIVVMSGDFDKDGSTVQTVFVAGDQIDLNKKGTK